MKISILVPWRSDGPDGHRQKLWDYLSPLWKQTLFEICVGEDDVYAPDSIAGDPLPFNCSQALNRAAARASGDIFVTMGADFYPNAEAVLAAARHARTAAHWVPVYGTTAYLSQQQTEELVTGRRPIERCLIEHTDPSCQGITAISATAWRAVDGMDEGYSGWGWEDTDLLRKLARKYGYPPYPYTRGISLWHPTWHRDLSRANPNRRRFEAGE